MKTLWYKVEISKLPKSFSALNTSITVRKCFKLVLTRKKWMHFILLFNTSHSLRSFEATIWGNYLYYNCLFLVYERNHSSIILSIANSTILKYLLKDYFLFCHGLDKILIKNVWKFIKSWDPATWKILNHGSIFNFICKHFFPRDLSLLNVSD